MAIGSLSFLDLTLEQRRASADLARQRFRDAMLNPTLTPEQIQVLQDAIAKMDRWEAGQTDDS